MNRWVGVLIVGAAGLLLAWSWQVTQEKRQLTADVTNMRGRVLQLRADKAELTAKLKEVDMELQLSRINMVSYEGALEVLTQRLELAEATATEMHAKIDGIDERESYWSFEQTRLEQQVALLQRTLSMRGPDVDASRVAHVAGTVVPPTAGEIDEARGNGGFIIRDGASQGVNVQVRPDTSERARSKFPKR